LEISYLEDQEKEEKIRALGSEDGRRIKLAQSPV
jgi:hypothetical protein